MFRTTKNLAQPAVIAALLIAFTSIAVQAQQTTGTATINATVSNYVELNSGGAVSLSGNSGGGVVTDGSEDSPLAVVVNFGELNPSNTNSFVKLTVPLKMRSNTAYQLNLTGSVSGAGSTIYSLKATDVGFGLVPSARPSTLASGTDTNSTPGDPTIGGSTNADGRWVYDGSNSTLGSFATSAEILSGPRINKTVPNTDTSGLVVPAIFTIKPQFYDPSNSVLVSATFTITAP